jgi:hypothetical protein
MVLSIVLVSKHHVLEKKGFVPEHHAQPEPNMFVDGHVPDRAEAQRGAFHP